MFPNFNKFYPVRAIFQKIKNLQQMAENPGKLKLDKDDEAQEVEKKNFIQKFISYFKYNPRLHRNLNHSLLYNAYYVVRCFLA